MIMWTLTIVSVLGSYWMSRGYRNHKKVFLWLAGIAIVLIMGSRYFINGFTDEITYNYEYEGYRNWSFERVKHELSKDRDWGFTLFYWGLAKIFPWRQFPIYFITAFFIFAAFRFIYYNLEETLIPVLLILAFDIFTFYMAGYRQCFSMCFCLFAFEFAKKNKFVPFLLLWLIAISMHISAYIFFPVYWLIKIKGTASWKIWILVVVAMMFLSRLLMEYAAEIFAREDYIERKEFSLMGFFVQVMIMAVPIIFTIFGVCEKNGKNDALLWLMIIGLIFYLSKFVYFSFERLSYYYTFFTIGAFSQSVSSLRQKDEYDKTRSNIKGIICVTLIVLAFLRIPIGLNFFWNY